MNKNSHKKTIRLPDFNELEGTLIAKIQIVGDKIIEKRRLEGKEPPIPMGRGQTGQIKPMKEVYEDIIKYNKKQLKQWERPEYDSKTYDPSAGENLLRKQAVTYLNKLFELNKLEKSLRIKTKNIIFSTGSLESMKGFANTLKGKILVASPYYINYEHTHKIQPVNVLKNNLNWRFNPTLLEKETITPGSAIMFNDPNNPLGTKLNQLEIRSFVHFLKDNPDLKVAFDLAYFGIDFTKNRLSPVKEFLKEANDISPEFAKDLKDRMVVFFSGTKISGHFNKRPSVTIAFNEDMFKGITGYIDTHNLGSAIDSQVAMVSTLKHLLKSDRLSIASFVYGQGSNIVTRRLKAIGALPQEFNSEGGLFTVGVLGHLMGHPIPKEAEEIIGKGDIDNNLKLCISLMVGIKEGDRGVITVPVNPQGKNGMLRFFCGGKTNEIEQGMNEISVAMRAARLSPNKFYNTKKELSSLSL